jgi:hypothetical protein
MKTYETLCKPMKTCENLGGLMLSDCAGVSEFCGAELLASPAATYTGSLHSHSGGTAGQTANDNGNSNDGSNDNSNGNSNGGSNGGSNGNSADDVELLRGGGALVEQLNGGVGDAGSGGNGGDSTSGDGDGRRPHRLGRGQTAWTSRRTSRMPVRRYELGGQYRLSKDGLQQLEMFRWNELP